MNEIRRSWSISGLIALVSSTLLLLLFVNHFVQIIPLKDTRVQGITVLLPSIIGPLGLVFGVIGRIRKKDRISLWGIVLSSVVTILPQIYWFFGTFLWGV